MGINMDDQDIHIIPNDSPDHIESVNCFCNPTWDEQNKAEYNSGLAHARMYVHKSLEELKQ